MSLTESQLTQRTSEKPYMGRIDDWVIIKASNGSYVEGKFLDHPQMKYFNSGHTSKIVSIEGNEVETLNSRYTLVNPYK